MKNVFSKLLMIAVGLMIAAPAMAGRTRVDRRQGLQGGRIADGVASGELTKQEARKLGREQRHIKRAERRAASDGVVTPEEKQRLERKQDRASRHIYKQKHDGQQQGGDTAAPATAPAGN